MRRLDNVEEPADEDVVRVLKTLHHRQPKVAKPNFFLDPPSIRARVKQIFEDDINMDSSPGVPLLSAAPTNKQLFEGHLDLVQQLVVDRIYRLLSIDDYSPTMQSDFILCGYTDPIRVFIKNEPHKHKKLSEGRYRIISSVSITDQIIDRMLFGELNDAEIFNWRTTISKGGAGLSTDEQAVELAATIKNHLKFPIDTDDVSTWDWVYKAWLFRVNLARRLMTWGYEAEEAWLLANKNDCLQIEDAYVRMAIMRYRFLEYNYFCLSDGTILMPGEAGIQKSGGLNTLSDNSYGRGFLCKLLFGDTRDAHAGESDTMGDDCCEKTLPDNCLNLEEAVVQRYARYGFPITDFKRNYDFPIEFCSHLLYEDKAVPLNHVKMIFKYLHSDLRRTIEQRQQIKSDLRHSPAREWIYPFLAQLWSDWANEESQEYVQASTDDRKESCKSSKDS
jgi:hypothetical protein